MSQLLVKINEYFKDNDLMLMKAAFLGLQPCEVCGKDVSVKGYAYTSHLYIGGPLFCSMKCFNKW